MFTVRTGANINGGCAGWVVENTAVVPMSGTETQEVGLGKLPGTNENVCDSGTRLGAKNNKGC